MMRWLTCLSAATALCLSPIQGWAADNPFLRADSVNDCDVLKYNGEYYITGNWLSGQMLFSHDLVNWGNRRKVITHVGGWATTHPYDDLQIHASDLTYQNGVFHHYFQVDDKIGHAIGSSPWGMYTEPAPATAFGSNIDAEYFRDDSGDSYFYTVKFSSGNVIAGQRMTDPNTLTGTPSVLITAPQAPTTSWENTSGPRINEGPCVFKHRGRYYLLYNANETGNPNYQIGCVEASTPLGFSNAGKYPLPILARTQVGAGEINTLGQPWVIEGPNGFEKWLGYFAIYTPDGGGRYQCVDRMHFFDRRLFVDGPTSRFTAGYHPDPARPTLLALFNVADGALSDADWQPLGAGSWGVTNREARQTLQNTWSLNTVQRQPAQNYLFEANFRFNEAADAEDKAGVLAYYADERNWMIVGVDRVAGNWYCHRQEQGVNTIVAGGLGTGWNHTAYHKIRVARNGPRFDVMLDGIRPPGGSTPILTTFRAEGRPGLYADHSSASYDGVIYTIGWDEYDAGVTGWGNGALGDSMSGNWTYGIGGIAQTEGIGTNRVFKGDLMPQYEFSTQVYQVGTPASDGLPHTMGIIAVAIDTANHLEAHIDLMSHELVVEGALNGVALSRQTRSVGIADNYHLRAVKLSDRVLIFVDGKELVSLSAAFGPSQVGLSQKNATARYNGILVYRTEPAGTKPLWESRDLGTVAFPGNTEWREGTVIVNGSGADIWDVRDAGHFAYQVMTGNGQIVARLDSMDPTDFWAKAGVMFRENLNDNSRMVFLCANAGVDGTGDQHQLAWRSSTGGGTGSSSHASNPVLPNQGWMKLVRAGSTFTGYYSTNGSSWVQVGSCQVAMASTARVGLAVSSHNTNRVSGAVFERVSVSPEPTTTSIDVQPASLFYGDPATLVATVSAGLGTPLGSVTFKDGAETLGTGTLARSAESLAIATLQAPILKAGTHSLSVSFAANASFAASSSGARDVVVGRREVSVTGMTASNKTYDGTAAASLSGTPELVGRIAGDTLELAGTPVATFPDANAGTGRTVTASGFTLTGSAAPNYNLVAPGPWTASIFPAETTTTLTTSANPALPGTPIIQLATVSAKSAGTGRPSEKVEFRINRNVEAVVALSGEGTAELHSTVWTHGSNFVTAVYLGDGNFLGSTGSLTQIVNTPPQGMPILLSATSGAWVRHALFGGSSAPSDADHDLLAVVSTGPAAHGTATWDGEWLNYQSAEGFVGRDFFSYTVRDPFGATDTAVVTVDVQGVQTGPMLVEANQDGARFRFRWTCEIGKRYSVLSCTDVGKNDWVVVKELAAAETLMEFVADLSPDGARFFRVSVAQ